MSIFPTGTATFGRRIVESGAGLETDGVLVRPIKGQIYLIEEEDLEGLMDGKAHSPLSGLVSRH